MTYSRLEKREFCRGRKVLLVDDNPDVLWLLNDLLRRSLEVEISTAQNGKVAVETAREVQPDLILMDLMMPVMNGLEAIREIKNDESIKKVPVVAFTALINTFQRDEVMKHGFVECLEKPLDFDQLKDMVFRYIT
ncbi:MAG: response regulator [bacterium]